MGGNVPPTVNDLLREGVKLDRDHGVLPLVDALRRHVMVATKLHADDTPVPVFAPGNDKTKTDGCGSCATTETRAT